MDLPDALSVAVVALAGAVSFLFRDLYKKSSRCESDRAELWRMVGVHEKVITVFRTCPTTPCPAAEAVQKLNETFSLAIHINNHSSPNEKHHRRHPGSRP